MGATPQRRRATVAGPARWDAALDG